MARPGEHTYYEKIGAGGRAHAVGKPFAGDDRGALLMEAGAVLSLLPPAPARVLECGCGTGWFAYFMARSGYDVVAQDVAEYAIELARSNPMFAAGRPPLFVAGDFETLGFSNEFDAVVFLDALHHAIDEEKVLRLTFEALRPGGVAILSEPGVGHAARSRKVMETYDVTDKDMPPWKIVRIARRVGYSRWMVFPHGNQLQRALFADGRALKRLLLLLYSILLRRENGITLLVK